MKNIVPRVSAINLKIEALRGYAAALVVLSHIIFYSKLLDPKYFPKFISFFYPPAHLCVLVFFLLSGYVIEISHSDKNALTKNNYLLYIKKRLIRLYPIYFLAVFFALFVSNFKYSWVIVLNNMTFAQNIFFQPIYEINTIWSLNYEIIFYLAFIPFSLFKINPIKLIYISIAAFILLYFLNIPRLQILASYFIGLIFWLSGVLIARNSGVNENPKSDNILLSNLFLLLSLQILLGNLISYIFSDNAKQFVYFPKSLSVNFHNLFYLPYCIIFVSNFANRKAFNKSLLLVFQLIPLLGIYPAILLISDGHYTVIFGILTYFISMCIYFWNSNITQHLIGHIISIGAWLGGVSYSLYLIHFPILVLFSKMNFFSGSGFTYVIRFILYVFIITVISYFLEKKYQLFMKNLLLPKRTDFKEVVKA